MDQKSERKYYYEGLFHERQGNYKEAIKYYKKATHICESYAGLAKCYSLLGKESKADSFRKKIEKLKSKNKCKPVDNTNIYIVNCIYGNSYLVEKYGDSYEVILIIKLVDAQNYADIGETFPSTAVANSLKLP